MNPERLFCDYCDAELDENGECTYCGLPGLNNGTIPFDEMPPDYGFECAMCGKDMPFSRDGFCSSCRQVWNG